MKRFNSCLTKLKECVVEDDGWELAMAIRLLSPVIIVFTLAFLNSCATAPDIEVKGKVNIDCGPEPRVSRLTLFPIKIEAYYDKEAGKAYTKMSIGDYEKQALNAKRIEQHFVALGALIEHYRSCVRDFNDATT